MNTAMHEYYERRSREYDDWWLGTGRFVSRQRPGWHEEVLQLRAALEAMPPANTLDLACGTGFLTRYLPGDVTGIDQSAGMLAVAAERVPSARFVQGDALAPEGEYERVFSAHFYGHLDAGQRERFLAGARAVAPELVIVDSAKRPDVPAEAWEERVLNDGSRHEVYKRWFTAELLAQELGGAAAGAAPGAGLEVETLHAGSWFVAVRAR